jgi:DNA-binding MarR family transcriptional regulator
LSPKSQYLNICDVDAYIPFDEKKERLRLVLDKEEWLEILPALENVERFNLVIFLANAGRKTFTQIKEARDLSPGNCTYHLNKLMKAGLVVNQYHQREDTREYSYYEATDKAKEVLEALLQ